MTEAPESKAVPSPEVEISEAPYERENRLESERDVETPHTLRLLADQPIANPDQDLLDYHPLAEALAAILLDPDTDTPLTVSVSAPWGAGKTSLARLTEYELKRGGTRADSPLPVTIWFNAWQHDRADNIGAAFASAVARGLGPNRNWLRRLVNPIPIRMLSSRGRVRRRVTFALCLLALVAILVVTLVQTDLIDQFDEEAVGIGVFPGLPLAFAVVIWLWGKLNSLSQTLSGYINDPDLEAGKGAVSDVRSQLGRLVAQVVERSRPRRAIIFVDDLDRASPLTSIDVCETAAQLLDHRDVVVVFLADVPALEAAATKKYSSDAGSYVPRDALGGSEADEPNRFGRIFLQKLVQFQISLPPATPEQIKQVASRNAYAGVGTEDQPSRLQRFRRFWRPSDDRKRSLRLGVSIALLYLLINTLVLLADSMEGVAIWFVWSLMFVAGIGLYRLVVVAMRDRAIRDSILAATSSLGLGGAGVVMSILGAISIIAFTVYLFSVAARATDWAWAWWIGSIVLAFGALGAVAGVVSNIKQWRRARLETRVRADAKRLIMRRSGEMGDAFLEESDWGASILAELIEDNPALVDEVDYLFLKDIVLESAAEFVAVDSQARRQAEKEVVAHLTPLPRSAKRLVNRLRFILHVSQRKGLLRSCLEPEAIGKWAVLIERWPSLSWTVTLKPDLIKSLETAASQNGDMTKLLSNTTVSSVDDLARFLTAGETRLGDMAEALVYLRCSKGPD